MSEPVGNGGLRDLFPGYYLPSKADRQRAYRRGLVSIDASALLDLYRLTPLARNEFFAILERLSHRLFVTHQATQEFLANRLAVVDARISAISQESTEVRKLFNTINERVREFANRYQIDESRRTQFVNMVDDVSSKLVDALAIEVEFDLTREDVKASTDEVLVRLERILKNRIGPPFPPAREEQEFREAARRIEQKVPPGYMDGSKSDQKRAAGDYFLWAQLLDRARSHDGPVLLITNDKKEDWVRIGSKGENLGPRPELVLEMKQKTDSEFQMVTVAGILRESPEHLGTHVSPSTIQEAESLPESGGILVEFTPSAREAFVRLSVDEQNTFAANADKIARDYAAKLPTLKDSGVQLPQFLVRISDTRRAICTLDQDTTNKTARWTLTVQEIFDPSTRRTP